MGSEQQEEPPKELSFWVLAWIALGVIALWAGTGFLLYDTTLETPIWGERGTFGDMFGSINALFSGLAFAGLFFTVLLQRQELQLQRHELKLQRGEIQENRKELAGQRLQLEAQSKTFSKQSFEFTFFSLIQRLGAVSSVPTEGISWAFQAVRDSSAAEMMKFGIAPDDLISAVHKAFARHARDHHEVLDVFHQVLFTTLRYVDDSDQENKRFYTDVVRSCLSHGQLFCAFYTTALNDDPRHSELRVLIEKYGLFKYLPPSQLLSPEHMRAFASTAFG